MNRPNGENTQYVLNVPLLVGTVIVVVVVGAAGFFWHRWQYSRLAGSLLTRAVEFEKEDKPSDAAEYLFKYLQMRPDDAEARILLAKTFDKAATSRAAKARAVGYYRYAVGLADSPIDLQHRLAELLLEIDRYADARKQAAEILAKQPDSASAARIEGLASYREGVTSVDANWPAVAATVKKALQANPTDVQLAEAMADIYRGRLLTPDSEAADKVINQMVTSNDASAEALLARYRYRRRFQLPGADDDLDQAMAKAPNDAEILLAAGERAMKNDQLAEANKLFAEYVAAEPDSFVGYRALALVQTQQNDLPAAVATLRTGLEKVGPSNFFLGWQLVDLLIAQRDYPGADAAIRDIESGRANWPAQYRDAITAETEFFKAKSLLGKNKPYDALKILTRLASTPFAPLDGQKYLTSPAAAQYWLGAALMSTAQWDQAAAAYDRVLAAAPTATQVRITAAQAHSLAGQIDEAARHIDFLRKQKVDTPQVRLLAARISLQDQLRRPENERNWDQFNAALAAAGEATEWEWPMLRAEQAIALGETEKAIELLQAAEKAAPSVASCLKAVAGGYERLGKHEEADRILAKWEEQSGDTPEALLAKSASLLRRGRVDEAIAVLKSGAASTPEPARSSIRHQIAQLQIRAGQLDAARQTLAELSASNPGNLQWLKELAELSIETKDWESVKQCEQRLIDEVEGQGGSWWRYYRARRLLAGIAGPQDPHLAEADRLSRELQAARPRWPEAQLLRGMIAELQRNPRDVVAAYRKAIELGDRRQTTYERLVPMLLADKRFDEASKLMADVEEANQSPRLSHIAMALSLQQTDDEGHQKSSEMAAAWVARSPKDPLARVWLAQTFMMKKQNAEAEAELKKAIELSPNDFRIRVPLVMFYAQSGQPEAARGELATIEREIEMPAATKASVLAQGYDLIGDLEAAEKHYREAARIAPTNADIQQQFATFLVRSKGEGADEAIQRLELAANDAPSRRRLAMLLANQGKPNSVDKAIRLMNEPETDPAESVQNERLKANLLVTRNQPGDRDEATSILTKLASDSSVSVPQDFMLLATLLEMSGKTTAARQQLEKLATSARSEPMHWGTYADFLLRHDLLRDATTWIRRLEDKNDESLSTISLRARLMHKEGQDNQIEQLVEPAVEKLLAEKQTAPEKAQIEQAIGKLYQQLENNAAAIRHFQQAYQLAPATYGQLVAALVADDQVAEAVKICQQQTGDDNVVSAAILLAAAIAGTEQTLDDLAAAEPLFAAALQQNANNANLLLALSGVRFVQGQYDDVIALSRKLLANNPNHIVAMNNLASLLAEKPSTRPEALQLVDRAIAAGGRTAMLLDTKGIVLLYDGRTAEAIELLEEAVAASPNDPRYQFHLALAYKQDGNVRRAAECYKRAEKAKLSPTLLTPHERTQLESLKQFVTRDGQARKRLELPSVVKDVRRNLGGGVKKSSFGLST